MTVQPYKATQYYRTTREQFGQYSLLLKWAQIWSDEIWWASLVKSIKLKISNHST